MSTLDYYREDHHPSTLLHSPHAHSPVSSPHIIKSQFDPYPSQLSQSSYPVSPSSGRSAYPTLEMPTPYHSDNQDGGHPSTPPRVSTPSQSNNYYAYDYNRSGSRGPSANDAVDPAFIRQVTPDPRHLSVTPEPHSPQRGGGGIPQSFSGPTLKVIQWTPQHGDEGTQVTIILDPLAVRGAARTASSVPMFGPGSPALGGHRSPMSAPVTRRFAVIFGNTNAPTKFTRANTIDGNGVGASMTSGPGEDDAFVILTTFVPARQTMGPIGERVMVLVQVLDEVSRVLEECIVGEWDAQHPTTPPRILKRHGDELINERASPALRSPALSHQGSPMLGGGNGQGWLSPAPVSHQLSPSVSHQLLSPRVGGRSTTPADGEKLSTSASLRHPPIENPTGAVQPDLLRTSQIPSLPQPSPFGGSYATYSNKALLKLQGDLNQMAMGWSNEEWTNRRRLIQFWRQQEGNVINATFRPIAQSEFVPNSIVISCIFRDEWNECFVTSVDTIYLLEALVGVRFTVEEKNRIRRNLEGFKPMTVSKSKQDSEPFFKLIMGFPNPKPRNIEKDVKVFPWKVLSSALKKIISKYSATYSAPVDGAVDESAGHVLASPLSVQGERFSAAPRSPSQLNTVAGPNDAYSGEGESHSPGEFATGNQQDRAPFDFGSIIDTSTFADPSGDNSSGPSASASATPSNSANGGTHGAYAAGPPEVNYSSNNLFPSAEDYGVIGGERLAPPAAMVHSRSYSEGPRKGAAGAGSQISYSAGASPYGAGATAEYSQQDHDFGYSDDR